MKAIPGRKLLNFLHFVIELKHYRNKTGESVSDKIHLDLDLGLDVDSRPSL